MMHEQQICFYIMDLFKVSKYIIIINDELMRQYCKKKNPGLQKTREDKLTNG
jgi:hypothetical protein